MDHTGALIGALLASLLLWLGVELRVVFALALLPGLAAVFVLWRFVPDVERELPEGTPADAPDALRRLLPFLGVVVPSAIAGSVDLFALMRARELGLADALLPLLWAVLHVVRAALAAPFGRWSDRFGRRRLLAAGLVAHALVLLGFAASVDALWLWPLFGGLGLHAACTEGAERGYVADLTGAHKRGTVFGVYHAVHGLAAFGGPVALGALWQAHGAGAAFAVAAGAAGLGVLWLGLFVPGAGPRGPAWQQAVRQRMLSS
jgi:MFS family permease